MTDVLIMGTGALASLFAFRINSAGYSSTMIGTWQEAINAVNQKGVQLVSGDEQSICAGSAASDLKKIPRVDLALVLVKSWQTARAAKQLQSVLSSDGLALTLQNGLGNQEILASRLGSERTALGVTTTGATLEGPARVRLGGEGEIILGAGSHPRLPAMKSILEEAGFRVRIAKNLDGLIWEKLIVNTSINPLSALLRVKNGVLLDSPAAVSVMEAAADEAYRVAIADGVSLQMESPIEVVADVARKTAQNRSSMLQDVLRGAPTEIEFICGAVVRKGKQAGIPTPVNLILLRTIKALIETKENRL